jgi:hypothetical protein
MPAEIAKTPTKSACHPRAPGLFLGSVLFADNGGDEGNGETSHGGTGLTEIDLVFFPVTPVPPCDIYPFPP